MHFIRLAIIFALFSFPHFSLTSNTLSNSPSWTAYGDQSFSYFGTSISTAGDVNGDGFDDIIIGDQYFDNGVIDSGRAIVYFGSQTGLSATPNWTDKSDQYEGFFGASVSSAGDVNGDGYSDIVIGAPQIDNGQTDEGFAYVYYGSHNGLPAEPSWTYESNQAGAKFGSSVSSAGDVNGDGYDDVIIGAPLYDNDQIDEGSAFIFFGSASGLMAEPDWATESSQTGSRFGGTVSTAGDVNSDGYSEVMIGAYSFDNDQIDEGRVFVYFGSDAGMVSTPPWTVESDQTNSRFGQSLSNAGDINDDGFSDVIIGAWLFDNDQVDEGRAYIYYGSATGLGNLPAWTGEGDQAGARYGVSVSSAGDINIDDYDDVIVGASYYSNAQIGEGRAFIFTGSDIGPNNTPFWTAMSDQSYARFGHAVSRAGDVNGDGYSDIMVSAPWFRSDLINGIVYVYCNFAAPVNQPPNSSAGTDQIVETNALVTLDGSASSDPDGHLPLSYQWSQKTGPSVTLSSATSASPTFTAPNNPATLEFSLTVTDALGLTSVTADTIQVTVTNQAPISSAGADATVITNAIVVLDGTGSSDPDGHLPLVFLWNQVSGPSVTLSNATTASPTFTAPNNPATLVFSLTVTDNLGLNSTTADTVQITVTNQAPISYAGADQTVETMEIVMLDGSASSDPDGHLPLSYHWNQVSGPTVTLSTTTGASPTFVAPSHPATLVFSLTATDSLGLDSVSADTVQITVNNQAPVLTSIGNKTGIIHNVMSFTVAATDPEGDPLTFSLDAGAPDGSAINPITGVFTWTPTATGSFTLTIRVSDNHAPAGEDFETIIITIEKNNIFLPMVVN